MPLQERHTVAGVQGRIVPGGGPGAEPLGSSLEDFRPLRIPLLVLLFLSLLTLPAEARVQTHFSGDLDLRSTYLFMESRVSTLQRQRFYADTILRLELKPDKGDWDGFAAWRGGLADALGTDRDSRQITSYRWWIRHRGKNLETRIGLQEIVFGHAYVLRPLALFDTIDPTDRQKRTGGVRAVKLRWFPDEQTGIQAWLLNSGRSGAATHPGLRINRVLTHGELGVTVHNWRNEPGRLPEDVIGLDGFFDLGPGLWFEAVEHRARGARAGRPARNRQVMLGMDTTLAGVGNGLHLGVEYLRNTMTGQPAGHAVSSFADLPLTGENHAYLTWFRESTSGGKWLDLRLRRDARNDTILEYGWQWTDRSYDALPPALRWPATGKGPFLRVFYSW